MAIYINNEKMKPMSFMEVDMELDEEDLLLPGPDIPDLKGITEEVEETNPESP
jgi:hypothetical protein